MMTSFESAFVLLFAIATGVALLARRIRAPYTVALVLAGLALGSLRTLSPPQLTKELMFGLFLPGLLFEAAFHIEYARFRRNLFMIVSLAVPGVALAIGVTSLVVTPVARVFHLASGFGIKDALVFAALIAATDPIAVVAMFKSLGAPKRLGVLIDAESLLNDGTAVVFFTIVMGLFTGHDTSISHAAVDFVKVVGMGVIAGALVAFVASAVMRFVDDAMIEITITTVAAYGSFSLAEQLHVSGVIATVTAGMILGNHARRERMSPSTRVAIASFWEYVAFALNSVVFLLIGFQVRMGELLASWKIIIVAYLGVTVARAVVVAGVTAVFARTRERIPWSWSVVLVWGGLRGALSMVLVLSTPPDHPYRQMLVTMTYGVVLLSLLLQGLTISPLLRRLGVAGTRGEREPYELLYGKRRAAGSALVALGEMLAKGQVNERVAAEVRADYEKTIADTDAAIRDLHVEASALAEEEAVALRRSLLVVEKDAVLEAERHGMVGEAAGESLLRDIDARTESVGGAAREKDE
ncbi:MAG TPA: cation:proton antiporter [Polyangiaceae bacterium]|nr:cation:proton antiporter [Polyangiaceae bacterium]